MSTYDVTLPEIHYIQLPNNEGKYRISDLDWKTSVAKNISNRHITQWNSAYQYVVNNHQNKIPTYVFESGDTNGVLKIKKTIGTDISIENITVFTPSEKTVYLNEEDKIDNELIDFPSSEEKNNLDIIKILDSSSYIGFTEQELEDKLDEGFKSIQFYGFLGQDICFPLSSICDIQILKNHLDSQSFICNLTCDIELSSNASLNQVYIYDIDNFDISSYNAAMSQYTIDYNDWQNETIDPETGELKVPEEPERPEIIITKTTYQELLSQTIFFDVNQGLVFSKEILDNRNWLTAKELDISDNAKIAELISYYNIDTTGLSTNEQKAQAILEAEVDAIFNHHEDSQLDNIFTAFNNANNQNNEHNYFELKARYIR